MDGGDGGDDIGMDMASITHGLDRKCPWNPVREAEECSVGQNQAPSLLLIRR